MPMKKLVSLFMTIVLVLGIVTIPKYESKAASLYTLSGEAHVQTYGDKAGSFDGKTLTLGTKGQAKRLESIKINFKNNTGYSGDIEYRVHRQTYGWTGWVKSGEFAGTKGEGKRLEGIQIRLTGELAKHYSVKYRVHIQTYGDNQGWMYDGAMAGTEAEAKRLENLEVQLVPRTETMNVAYRVHRQTYGWEKTWLKNGQVSGTTGQSKRLEGIEIALIGNQYSGNIHYQTQVQSYGWMNEVQDGMMSGTSGKAKRLEAIKIYLSGEVANYYDVYYRVHAQSFGWLGWVKNGEVSGTVGLSKRLEAIQIMLVKKNSGTPGNVGGITSNTNDGSKQKEEPYTQLGTKVVEYYEMKEPAWSETRWDMDGKILPGYPKNYDAKYEKVTKEVPVNAQKVWVVDAEATDYEYAEDVPIDCYLCYICGKVFDAVTPEQINAFLYHKHDDSLNGTPIKSDYYYHPITNELTYYEGIYGDACNDINTQRPEHQKVKSHIEEQGHWEWRQKEGV